MCPENEAARLLPREHQPAMLMLDCSEYFPFVVKKWKNWRHTDIRASDSQFIAEAGVLWPFCYLSHASPPLRHVCLRLATWCHVMTGEKIHTATNTDTRQWHFLSFFRPIKWFFFPPNVIILNDVETSRVSRTVCGAFQLNLPPH